MRLDLTFPEATAAWRRLKLSLAELLVLSILNGDHTAFYTERVLEVADDISDIKKTYYPHPKS